MKPTTDIVEELRLYNRWRRGDEAITAPDPTTLGKLLDDAADRIEHLFASGIHTCHADCQRPMCVLRRERDKAQADLARVTAERDGYVSDIERFVWNLAGCDTIASGWGKPGDYAKSMALPALDSVSRMAADHAALRARVAELEQAEAYVALLQSTGMAYEFSPESIAYRSYLDGLAAGAASSPEAKRLNWALDHPEKFHDLSSDFMRRYTADAEANARMIADEIDEAMKLDTYP